MPGLEQQPVIKMKFHDKTVLCLTHAEYSACFGIDAYKNHKKRGQLLVYGSGGNERGVLIDYETLSPERKAIVKEKYGNPYEYIVKQPLTDWVQINWNKKAHEFYNKYVLKTGTKIPEDYRDKYTNAITYLDAIGFYTADKLALKRDFNINMAAFWGIVSDVLTAEKVALPKNEKRLKQSLSKYKKQGFEFIIEHHRFGNDNSKKVKDQLAEDILMKLLSDGNNHDDVVVAETYNLWAAAHDRQTITSKAVTYRRKKYFHEIVMERKGKSAAYNMYNKQIKQSRATSPLMMINSDDNVLDLYFKEVTYSAGRKATNNYYRPVMYAVIDTFNDYVLGYAVGETVTIELIKEAYRNAMAHIIELTGGAYLWHQIKTDKWSIDPKLEGTLASFLKMGGETKFFPASVAQSKYIERVFGNPLHRVLKVFPNYSGANITAHGPNARPNTDMLQKRSKDFPDKKHAPAVIEMAINSMRHSMVNGTEVTRQQQWVTAFNESNFCKQRAITEERKLELLGVTLPYKASEPHRLKVNGLNFQLNNVKYSFDIPASYFPEHLNKAIEIIYDPADMGSVLVTDHKGIRFITSQYNYQPSAIADMKPGDGQLLHERMEESRAITKELERYMDERNQRLERADIDAHSLYQAGILTKSINHKAQKTIGGYNETDEAIPAPVKKIEKRAEKALSIYDEM